VTAPPAELRRPGAGEQAGFRHPARPISLHRTNVSLDTIWPGSPTRRTA